MKNDPDFIEWVPNTDTEICSARLCNKYQCRLNDDQNTSENSDNECWTAGKTVRKIYDTPDGPSPDPWPSIYDFKIVNVPHRWNNAFEDIYYLTLQNQTRFFDYKLRWSADAASCSAQCPSGGCGAGWSGL